MTFEQVISELKAMANPNEKDLEGMKRFGINTENTLCIGMTGIDSLTKKVKKETPQNRHQIALELWKTGIREARILAGRIDVPELVTVDQMESWVKDFNSWDVCDNTIMKDFSYSKLGWKIAIPWSKSSEEFVKRAGFVMMAMLAMHDKAAKDEDFYPFLKRIKEEATDERNFVRKAVNWALRTIGKARTKNLYNLALETSKNIIEMYPDSKSAKWIAKDAIRELTTSKYILKRFKENR